MNKLGLLEVCVDSVESAVTAAAAGADRLELCSNLMIGGTTPTLPFFKEIRKQCSCCIHVLIRPRFGDFCYSDYEFAVMKEEVRQFESAGAEGIVIGILREDGRLNCSQMEQLMKQAGDMSVTLHRAFDVCSHPFETLKEAKELGIRTILTSGQENTCVKGIAMLQQLQELAAGQIDILAGSGIDSSVIEQVYQETGITSYHMSGKRIADSSMRYRKEGVHMGLDTISEFAIWQTDEAKILAAVNVLQRCVGMSK